MIGTIGTIMFGELFLLQRLGLLPVDCQMVPAKKKKVE